MRRSPSGFLLALGMLLMAFVWLIGRMPKLPDGDFDFKSKATPTAVPTATSTPTPLALRPDQLDNYNTVIEIGNGRVVRAQQIEGVINSIIVTEENGQTIRLADFWQSLTGIDQFALSADDIKTIREILRQKGVNLVWEGTLTSYRNGNGGDLWSFQDMFVGNHVSGHRIVFVQDFSNTGWTTNQILNRIDKCFGILWAGKLLTGENAFLYEVPAHYNPDGFAPFCPKLP